MSNDLPESLQEMQDQLYNVAIATGLGVLHGLEEEHSKGDLVSLLIGTHVSTAAFFINAAGLNSRTFLEGISQLMSIMHDEATNEKEKEEGSDDPSTKLFASKATSTVN